MVASCSDLQAKPFIQFHTDHFVAELTIRVKLGARSQKEIRPPRLEHKAPDKETQQLRTEQFNTQIREKKPYRQNPCPPRAKLARQADQNIPPHHKSHEYK